MHNTDQPALLTCAGNSYWTLKSDVKNYLSVSIRINECSKQTTELTDALRACEAHYHIGKMRSYKGIVASVLDGTLVREVERLQGRLGDALIEFDESVIAGLRDRGCVVELRVHANAFGFDVSVCAGVRVDV